MKSPIPPDSIPMWTDGRYLFAAPGGHIMKFPLTEGGLSKALTLLRTKRFDFSGMPTLTRKLPETLQEAMCDSMLRQLGAI